MADRPHTCHEAVLRQALVDAVTTVEPQPALVDAVTTVEPQPALPTILAGARRRQAWLIALTATIGALLILVGLLLAWGQEQPAPPSSTSIHLLEA